jgi:hypothetical protein
MGIPETIWAICDMDGLVLGSILGLRCVELVVLMVFPYGFSVCFTLRSRFRFYFLVYDWFRFTIAFRYRGNSGYVDVGCIFLYINLHV